MQWTKETKNTEFYRTNASTRQPGQAGVCGSEQRKSQRKVRKRNMRNMQSSHKGKANKGKYGYHRSLTQFRSTHLLVPSIHTQLPSVHRVIQLGPINRTAVGSELAPEVRVEVGAGLVQGRDIPVATAPFAVGLGVVSVEVVTA